MKLNLFDRLFHLIFLLAFDALISCSSQQAVPDGDSESESGTATGTETDSSNDTVTGSESDTDTDTDTDSDTDADSDTDTDSDTDMDSDTDSDTDTDTDADTDTDSDSDTDTDADTDTDTDTDTDSDTECTEDQDCTLINDCCTCAAYGPSEGAPVCDVLCDAPLCDGHGGTITKAQCVLGRCVTDANCNVDNIQCETATPNCPTGQTPTATLDGGCYTSQCLDISECPGKTGPSCDFVESTCCSEDCPCADTSMQCVPAQWVDGSGVTDIGRCKEALDATDADVSCWSHADCRDYEFCEDAFVRGCGSPSQMIDRMGECVTASQGACDTASSTNECPTGYHCEDSPTGLVGICLHDSDGIQCWRDNDCEATQYCDGEMVCGADMNCASIPGLCRMVPLPD